MVLPQLVSELQVYTRGVGTLKIDFGIKIGLFPAVSAGNAEWLFRTTHFGPLVGDVAKETIQAVIRYMNAQSHYQIL